MSDDRCRLISRKNCFRNVLFEENVSDISLSVNFVKLLRNYSSIQLNFKKFSYFLPALHNTFIYIKKYILRGIYISLRLILGISNLGY